MSQTINQRRYLINFDGNHVGHVFTDVLVIGSGVAGLRAAIAASEGCQAIVLSKTELAESATSYAQGGIAAVVDVQDTIASHVDDTIRVGGGLCDRAVVTRLATEAADCIAELSEWGAAFDLTNGKLALGLEGGHSATRIVHAQGDATGRELSSTLIRQARANGNIRLFEHCFVLDLITANDRCAGALTYHPKYGHQIIWSGQTILASGGCGSIYRETTNPPCSTGDGAAIAFRAGAILRDMEFIQFHPTTLYIAGGTRALISEAVRGDGAHLVDRQGKRFMFDYHADGELAPRDVVSRAILDHMVRTETTEVYLDVRNFPAGRFAKRFPNITQLCAQFEIDVARDLIPVRPAAHYTIGGVRADDLGRTNIPDLLACGEAAASGAHGANRLASNSLLEGLVIGRAVGRMAATAVQKRGRKAGPEPIQHAVPQSPRTALDLADVCNSLRSLCWRNVGIVRTAARLEETIELIDVWARYVMDKVFDGKRGWEVQNMLTVARIVAEASMQRKESRGVHYRSDYPTDDPDRYLGHFEIQRGTDGLGVRFSPLGESATHSHGLISAGPS